MKYCLLLVFVYQISAMPFNDDKIYFPKDSDENFYTRFQQVSSDPVDLESRLDDDAGDLKLDLSSMLNDSNILKSDNDTEEFLFEEQTAGKLQYGELFQGDIELMPNQIKFLNSTDEDDLADRTGLVSAVYRWPKDHKGKVNVPYTCSNDYSYKEKIRIRLAMNDIEKYTCIRFTHRKQQYDYIHIKSGVGCSSNLGRIGGQQTISLLKNGCLSRPTIIHELIHALGFDHMQNRSDRDKFVWIIWSNIESKHKHNFEKVDPTKFKDFGTPYDYYSVMHYDPMAFSKNNRRTIIPKLRRYRNVIGQQHGMSDGDAKRLNKMYGCRF